MVNPGSNYGDANGGAIDMAITLIVRRADDPSHPDYQPIAMDEWLALIESDPALTIRADDHVAQNPLTGQEIRVAAAPAEADLEVDGQRVPLLQYRYGELVTNVRDLMGDATDLVRQKSADIARMLNAEIAHDAGDDLLDW